MKIPEKYPDIDIVINSGPLSTSGDVIRFAKEYNEKYLHWNDLKYREFGESGKGGHRQLYVYDPTGLKPS